jgi:hypothetical protein
MVSDMRVEVQLAGNNPVAAFESPGYLPAVGDVILIPGKTPGRYKVVERGVSIRDYNMVGEAPPLQYAYAVVEPVTAPAAEPLVGFGTS